MKNDTAMELLKLATSLACAVISQNSVHTANQNKVSNDKKSKGNVEVVLEDCLNALKAYHKDLTGGD